MSAEIDEWDYSEVLRQVPIVGQDDWMSNLLEYSMNLLRTKNIFNCNLRSALGTTRGGKFWLMKGKIQMSQTYGDEMQKLYPSASHTLADNYHLAHMNLNTYASEATFNFEPDDKSFIKTEDPPNHKQKPDSFSVMHFKNVAGENKTMAVLYEGENHKKNLKGPGKGGWLWNKMFQAMGRCHDIDSTVSGVMITTVMDKHNPLDYTADGEKPHFAQMAAAYLRAHVKLLAHLLEYNIVTNKSDSWIGRKLRALKPPAPVSAEDHYDFICTINALIHEGHSETHVSSTGEYLLEAAKESEGNEYTTYMDALWEFYPQFEYRELGLGERLQAWRTPVYRLQFQSGTHDTRGMNVVIHAVRRARSDALLESSPAPIVGVLYPTHVHELVEHLRGKNTNLPSHILKRPAQSVFEVRADELETLLYWSETDNDETWMFGLQMRQVRNIFNIFQLDYFDIQDDVEETKELNANRRAAIPRLPAIDDIMKTLSRKKQDTKDRALSCETTGYFMFILPLMYMSMAVFRKITHELNYQTGDAKTDKEWAAFQKTFLHERLARDNGAKTVSVTQGLLFSSKSNSLFSVILKATHDECEEMKFDTPLTVFFEKECGWEDVDRSDSPAMLFKILRTTTLLAAQTLAKQVLSAPPVRYTQILETFPLGLQTEIKYVMGRLASFLFFKASDWDGQEHHSDDADADDEDEVFKEEEEEDS